MTSDALTLAEAKHAELAARLDRAREQVETHRKKAHELAFVAEARDDDGAKRLATKLLADAAKLEADITHRLEPAVAEAERRVKAAKDAAAKQAQRAKAEEARALAARLEQLGAAIDAGFDQVRTAQREFSDVLDALRRLDAPAPSRELIEVNSKRALDAALAGVHPEARPVPTLQRHRFADLGRGWARPTLGWAAKILDADAERAA
jgi:hypothetical protein